MTDGSKSVTDCVTDSVTDCVTDSVTDCVTDSETDWFSSNFCYMNCYMKFKCNILKRLDLRKKEREKRQPVPKRIA